MSLFYNTFYLLEKALYMNGFFNRQSFKRFKLSSFHFWVFHQKPVQYINSAGEVCKIVSKQNNNRFHLPN
jgi:hypothetical protein